MSLEVEGSTPSIYPIITLKVNQNQTTQLKYLWLLFSLKLFTNCYVDLKFFMQYKLCKIFNIGLQNIFLKNNYKFLKHNLPLKLKSMYEVKLKNSPYKNHLVNSKIITIQPNNSTKVVKLFRTFLNVNTFSNTALFEAHPTWVAYYFNVSFGDGLLISIQKFFTRWKKTYYLLFNLFYYRIDLLVFGTSFFKNEVLSLNWLTNSSLVDLWRFVSPFFYFKPSKIFDNAIYIFYKLKLLGLNIALVMDISYHTKTLYYLKTTTFYTIGVVPLNLNMYSVNFAIPTASENLFTQLFTLKFIISIKKKTKSYQYNKLKSTWFSFYSQI